MKFNVFLAILYFCNIHFQYITKANNLSLGISSQKTNHSSNDLTFPYFSISSQSLLIVEVTDIKIAHVVSLYLC